jgi:hypothetical protein
MAQPGTSARHYAREDLENGLDLANRFSELGLSTSTPPPQYTDHVETEEVCEISYDVVR